jgi:hypothetical protein
MRYLLLVYEDERHRDALPAGERGEVEQACRDNDAAMRASGYLLAAETLHGDDCAATVWLNAGEVSVAEGAAARPQTQLRAVVTIRARDLNEAIQLAATMPQARLGPIEVWPSRAER